MIVVVSGVGKIICTLVVEKTLVENRLVVHGSTVTTKKLVSAREVSYPSTCTITRTVSGPAVVDAVTSMPVPSALALVVTD